MDLRCCGEFGLDLCAFLRGHGGEFPQVVSEDAPCDTEFSVFKAFALQRGAEVGIFEDADAAFGCSPAFLQYAEVFIFELVLQGCAVRLEKMVCSDVVQ